MSTEAVEKVTHTPGDWFVSHPRYGAIGVLYVCAPEDRPYYTRDPRELAVLYSSSPNQEANARLMAAAPDLLAALTMLFEETADYIRVNNLGDVYHNRSMQVARAAIAKAEGR